MTTRASTYERLGTVSLHIVLHAQGKIVAYGVPVSTGGLRMATFKKSGPVPCCSDCGLKAQYFAVERHKGTTGGYHLNLWGVGEKGNEVLFTHDHTLARSLGGDNKIHNTSTMCSACNSKKARIEHRQVQILRGELPCEPSRNERAKARKERRAEKIAERMVNDPEYAARVEFHNHRLRRERGVHAAIPS